MAVDSDQGRRSSAAASAIQRRPVAMESGSLTAIIIINIIIFANLDLLAHVRGAGEPGRGGGGGSGRKSDRASVAGIPAGGTGVGQRQPKRHGMDRSQFNPN